MKKRSDETPIEYFYRLNFSGLRAKMPIKDPRHPNIARAHVEHFIGTLGNRDLADQLTLLRISNAEELKLTLRTLQRAKSRQPKVEVGSNRYRSKPHLDQGKIPAARTARAIRMITKESNSSTEEESGQSSLSLDVEQNRHIFTTESIFRPRSSINGMDGRKSGRAQPDQDRSRKKCVHCGSSRHGDWDCWKIITCGKCDRKGHPSDHCFFVCKTCGKIPDAGACPIEEFFNLMRK